jgi:hypothetical protein
LVTIGRLGAALPADSSDPDGEKPDSADVGDDKKKPHE